MPGTEHSSSPAPAGFNTLQEEIAYYKSQYEQLEVELQEFQASSRELEAELEKDVEASEKRERSLKEKVESLNYEVEEWKTKHRQSKTEANNAQNALQKEITSLRDTSRSQQLKLRDVEVANDDFERQARNTTSSLEDLESKYNQTLERGVMLEEEIKAGEQEREGLRIEAQRLRDELSDLKIEADILQEKLRAAEEANNRRANRSSHLSETKEQDLLSPGSEGSVTSASLLSTFTPPPAKSEVSATTSDVVTPPSPPLSVTSGQNKQAEGTATSPTKQNTNGAREAATTPRSSQTAPKRTVHARGPSKNGVGIHHPTFKRKPGQPIPKPNGVPKDALPRSESLYQIRGLIGKMEKLEQRVHKARSKLPAPTHTPPRASPRGTTPAPAGPSSIPSNVTIRSAKKRSSAQSNRSSLQNEDISLGTSRRQSRISISATQPGPTSSRPSSRASNGGFIRPTSRAETHGPRSIPEPHRPASAAEARRPRSSMSGSFTPSTGHRQSQSHFGNEDGEHDYATPTPRRTTLDKSGISAIPTPTGLARRQSTQALNGATPARRKSMKTLAAAAREPPDGSGGVKAREKRQSSELGETF